MCAKRRKNVVKPAGSNACIHNSELAPHQRTTPYPEILGGKSLRLRDITVISHRGKNITEMYVPSIVNYEALQAHLRPTIRCGNS